jgi:hypothetical protein
MFDHTQKPADLNGTSHPMNIAEAARQINPYLQEIKN